MKQITLLLFLLLCSRSKLNAQAFSYDSIVHWTYSAVVIDSNNVELVFKARIKPGWFIGTANANSDVVVPTDFSLVQSSSFIHHKGIRETGVKSISKNLTELEGKTVYVYSGKAEFKVNITRKNGSAFSVSGTIRGMCFNDSMAINNPGTSFTISVPAR